MFTLNEGNIVRLAEFLPKYIYFNACGTKYRNCIREIGRVEANMKIASMSMFLWNQMWELLLRACSCGIKTENCFHEIAVGEKSLKDL